jgi:hypothetical protein
VRSVALARFFSSWLQRQLFLRRISGGDAGPSILLDDPVLPAAFQ